MGLPGGVVDEALRYKPYSWVRFPVGSLGFFIDNLSGLTVTLESTQPLNRNKFEEYPLWGKSGQCARLTTLLRHSGGLKQRHP